MQMNLPSKQIAGWFIITTVAFIALWLSFVPGWIIEGFWTLNSLTAAVANTGVSTALLSAGLVIPFLLITAAARLWRHASAAQ